MQLPGFIDISGILGGGVYVLALRGQVVFVGKADRQMLSRIENHRTLANKSVPDWFPVRGIRFDQILIQATHPDRRDEVYNELVARFAPRLNAQPKPLQFNRRAV